MSGIVSLPIAPTANLDTLPKLPNRDTSPPSKLPNLPNLPPTPGTFLPNPPNPVLKLPTASLTHSYDL